jgi:hypothetical protein
LHQLVGELEGNLFAICRQLGIGTSHVATGFFTSAVSLQNATALIIYFRILQMMGDCACCPAFTTFSKSTGLEVGARWHEHSLSTLGRQHGLERGEGARNMQGGSKQLRWNHPVNLPSVFLTI